MNTPTTKEVLLKVKDQVGWFPLGQVLLVPNRTLHAYLQTTDIALCGGHVLNSTLSWGQCVPGHQASQSTWLIQQCWPRRLIPNAVARGGLVDAFFVVFVFKSVEESPQRQ